MAAAPAKPPEEVPAAMKDNVANLEKPLAAILVNKETSWIVQAALGASGYITVEDLADCWNTPAAARENGPRDLAFQDGENGFNTQTLTFTAMRLLQAVQVAAQLVRGGNQGDHVRGPGWPGQSADGGPAQQTPAGRRLRGHSRVCEAEAGVPGQRQLPQEAVAADCQRRIGLHSGQTHRERASGGSGTPRVHP